MTGRTVDKWTRFGVDDSGGVPREIAIATFSPVGFVYDETDLTAYQDQVKGFLMAHPMAELDITGPFSTLAAAGLAASGVAPTLSGSYTVLQPISVPTFTTPLGLWIAFGIRGYWTAAADPAFGIVAPSATEGYGCFKFQREAGGMYSARFLPYPGSSPAWGTAILS